MTSGFHYHLFPGSAHTHYGIKERPIPPPPPVVGWLAYVRWQEKQAAGLAFKCDFFCSSSFPLSPPPPLALELKIHPRSNPMSRMPCSCKKVRLLFAEFFAQTGTARPRSQQPQRRKEEKREEGKKKTRKKDKKALYNYKKLGGGDGGCGFVRRHAANTRKRKKICHLVLSVRNKYA